VIFLMASAMTTLQSTTVAVSYAPRDMQVETVIGSQAFLEMEPLWTRVVEDADIGHPFAEHLWARTWLECFGGGSEPYILVVRSGGRPIGIAPLLRSGARIGGVPVRRLSFFYNDHVPRADFIVADRHNEVHAAIWAHLRADKSWDALQLCQIPDESQTLAALTRLAINDGHAAHVWQSGVSPYIPLTTTWLKYSEQLPTKHRANLRNRFKRLGALGPCQVQVVDSPVGLAAALPSVLQLEAAAWKGQAGTAIICQPELTNFYSLLAHRAAERGWLRLHFLESGGRQIAFDYSLEYKRKSFLLKLGYDPGFSAYSPSSLLAHEVIKAAFERGDIEYNFLGEFMDWKRPWAKQGRTHSWLFVFSRHWNARLACALKFDLLPRLKRSPLRPAAAWASRFIGSAL